MQPIREMTEQNKATLAKIGGTQADVDAWERGDVEFYFDEIADDREQGMSTFFYINDHTGEDREISAESMAAAKEQARKLLRQHGIGHLKFLAAKGRTGMDFPWIVTGSVCPVAADGVAPDSSAEELVQVPVTEQDAVELAGWAR
jgi:hypothetical protein